MRRDHYTEGSQAARLVEVARRYRVDTVVLQVGANDDAALVDTGIACIAAFLDPARRPCRETIGPLVAAADGRHRRGRCRRRVRDVREAMRRAGYAEGDYALVLASYAAPVTERMVPAGGRPGLPVQPGGRRVGPHRAVPGAVGGAARGRPSAPARGSSTWPGPPRAARRAAERAAGQEWQRRITVDPTAFVHGGLDAVGYHLAQESFHPNAAAHAELGRCLGEFVRSGDAAAACVPGTDGRLRLDRAGAAGRPSAGRPRPGRVRARPGRAGGC